VTMITSEDVAAAFDEVASRYDLMVALNPGYHAHLRAAANALVEWLPRSALRSAEPPVHILDLGCGSGASTRAVLRAAQASGLRSQIEGVDASPAMVEQALAKQWPAGVRFEVGQAEKIAWSGGSWWRGDPIDGAFAAYLFRNVADRDAVLAGLFDLLADGGVLVVQEYSIAESSFLAKAVWTAVCWLVVIPLGWLTSRRTRLYRYLWRSVRSFDSVQTFVDRLYRAGFVDVEVRTVAGWQRGILHTLRARKPSAAS
jgi:ubiquinone/menaquinone biosynthesis C-methylase UbiE